MKVFEDIDQDSKNMVLNSTPRPFSVQTIRVPGPVYRELTKLKGSGKEISFDYDPRMTDYVNVPVKLMIGCGRNGAICINFGFSEFRYLDRTIEHRRLHFQSTTIPAEILKFFGNLPPLYSVDAKKQKSLLVGMLEDLYDIEMDFKVFDLGALAVVNGCRMDDFSLFSLSALIRNDPFPVDVDSMDQNWAKDWDGLEPIMKTYIKEKFQLLFDTYAVLMGLLLRNIFPDPDVVLSVVENSQISFTSWFSQFIALALTEANLNKPSYQLPTRFDMILRMGLDTGLLGILADLIIRVPVATFGGERYLHHARYYFLVKQYYVLSRVKLHRFPGEIPNLSKNLDKMTFTLMFNREFVDDSGRQAYKVGLLPSRQYKKSLYSLDPDVDDVVCPLLGGNYVSANITEWGRLNVSRIPDLFAKLREMSLDDLAKFWLPRIRIYSSLSDIYFNMKNIRIIVSDLERSLKMRKERIEFSYQCSEEKRLLQLQQQRVNLIHQVSVSQSNKQRVGVHQYVQDILPGDSSEKNRLKASKRSKRMKRSKNKDPENFVSRNGLRLARRKEELSGSFLQNGDLRHKLQRRS